ncbi:MAG: AAA family ATPase [Pseudomonadota bacterium]
MPRDLSSTKSTKNKSTEQNRAAALAAAAAGFRVFPVTVKHKQDGSKYTKPRVAWGSLASTDPDQIRLWWRKWPDAVPGMATGDVFVVDLDDKDGKNGTAEYRKLGLDPDDAWALVRTPTGGQHLYFNGVDNLTISGSKAAPGIDTRGHGGFVFCPGAVSVFGEYTFERGDWFDLEHGVLSEIPAPIIEALTSAKSDAQPTKPGDYTPAELWPALEHVSSDTEREPWLEIVMAIHHATGGSKGGLALAQAWSARDYHAYDPKDVQTVWRSLDKKPGDRITADTLFARARANGWQTIDVDDILDDLDDPTPDDDLDALLGPDPEPEKPLDYDGLTFATPAECAASDPRPYLVKGLLAARDVACIVGAPGVGKSLLAPRLAYAVALGEPVFDRRVKRAGVFYVAAEDEHGMRGRLRALHDDLGDAPNLHLVGGVTDLLTTEAVKVKGKTRQRCRQADTLTKAVKEQRPGLVVIDTLAMAFPGLEENSAEGMGRVVALARRLTKWGAAVILIHHDTKAGDGLPRGHSLLNGALDVSIHLDKKASGVVRGKLSKNRNGSCEADLAFTIRPAEIGIDDDGDAITAAVCEPCDPVADMRTTPMLTERQQGALDALDDAGGVEWVSRADWRAAVEDHPVFIAIDTHETRKRAFNRSVKDLIERGFVEAESRDNGRFRRFVEYREIFDDL